MGDNNIISLPDADLDDFVNSDPLGSSHPPTGLDGQDPPGLLKLLGSKASGHSLMIANSGLSASQAVSPLIIRQSPGLTKVPPSAPVIFDDMADKQPSGSAHDNAPIPPPEGSDVPDNVSVFSDTVEAPDEAEPPNFHKICLALPAPSWEPSGSAGDFVNAHKKFVGNDPPKSARLGGPPTRSGLRRSASVSSQPHVNK